LGIFANLKTLEFSVVFNTATNWKCMVIFLVGENQTKISVKTNCFVPEKSCRESQSNISHSQQRLSAQRKLTDTDAFSKNESFKVTSSRLVFNHKYVVPNFTSWFCF